MRKIQVFATGLLLLLCSTAFAQKTVTGKVTDVKDGSAMPGVSVKVKGTTIGVSTSADGSYSINLPKGASTLVFSFVGYDEQEAEVKGNTASITLGQATKSLNEVVVVGFGQTKSREITGSVAKVKGADIQNMPVPNLSQALQGRAAGVFVESQNGKVGEGIKVRIRGATSISGSNQPLYVVDGVPIVASLYGSSTADINFNDVESFDILKDASAAAIYGSRASNGVVIITTKRGKAGKTRFNVNAQYGVNEPTNDNRGFLNAQEFLNYYYAAADNTAKYHYNRAGNWNGYSSLAAAQADMKRVVEGRFDRYSGFRPFRGGKDWRPALNGTPLVDNNWEKQAFQDANVSQIEVSAQGGNDKTKFFISAAVNNQDGILVANGFQRMSTRMNLDHEVNNWLKLGMNMSLTKTTRNRVPDDNAFSTPMQIVALAPITPTRDSLGVLFDRPVTTYYNPLIDAEQAFQKVVAYRNQGKFFADVRLLKGLNFHTEMGLDMTNQNEDRYWGPRTLAGGGGLNGVARNQWFRSTRWITNNYLNYLNTFGEKHKVDATVGMSFENVYDEYNYVEGQTFADENFRYLNNVSEITAGDGTKTEDNLVSYFGRINYAFDSKFLLTLSARIDGSSRFGANNQYGVYPAASVGYVITEEKFMQGTSKWLSYLKPRVSYGITGNNAIGLYQARGTYQSSIYATNPGLTIGNFGNAGLRWENTTQWDFGVDFGFLNNKITGEFDYYIKKTDDLLYNRPVPSTSGTTSLLGNIAEMENKGFEFTLNTVNVSTRNFRWSTSLNISRNRNKLLKIDGDQTEILSNDSRYANALVVGKPIGIFIGARSAGADPTNGDPIFYKEDGKTTTADFNEAYQKFEIGDPNPDWIGGVNNTVSWKGLEFSFLFQGVFGNQVQDGAGGFMSASADWFDNQTRDQLNSWKKAGDITTVPEARLNWFGDFASPPMSSRYVYDASYVRLKTVTLAYSVPQKLMNKLKLSTARFYVTGVNLLTFTDYPGWDPEVNTDYRAGNINQGSDFYAAPQIKSLVFGLTLGF